MTTVKACRMCLTVDTRMYTLADTPLQKIYEKITDVLLHSDGKPTMACYICHYLLQRMDTFIKRSVRADGILKEILSRGQEITEKSIGLINRSNLSISLSVTNTDLLTLEAGESGDQPTEVPVKIEKFPVKTEKAYDEPEEIEIDFSPPEQPLEDPGPPTQDHSDSEDDVPLKAFSTKSNDGIDKQKKSKVTVKKYKKSRDESKKLLENVIEITLTKEEQIAEVMARAKSLNYLNSPFKCELCYKGFVDARAFRNHRDKHDELRGAHACDVCQLRYGAARRLRAHRLAAHARHFACARCAHRSHTKNQAKEHEKWHNGHTYECQLCGLKFGKPTTYLTHVRKRHPTQHVCRECGLSFVGRRGLRMHRSKAHASDTPQEGDPPGRSACAACDIEFASPDAWQRHVLSSASHAGAGGVIVPCVTCGALVASGAALRAHVREHVRQRARQHARPPVQQRARLPCDQCDATFSDQSKLRAHVRRMHLGLKYDKHLVCEVCGRNCKSNAALTYHQRTHTGERPFPCDQCGKRFSDANQRRIHVRTHSGERPYCCALCGKRFSQKPALNRHYRVHTGVKPYACQFCAKTFTQSNSLKLHVSTVHLKLPHAKKKAAPAAPAQDL